MVYPFCSQLLHAWAWLRASLHVIVLQLAAACLGMGDQSAEYRPPITFVVVQKRHHTRLFPTKPNEGDRSGNIMPGQFLLNHVSWPFSVLRLHAHLQHWVVTSLLYGL